jgi:hypothetical protein
VTVLHELPRWLFALLTVGVFVVGAISGLIYARRFGHSSGLHALVDNSVIGWIFSAILVIYAIAIGMIAVASWGNSSEASSVASHEAAALAALYRDLSGYPQPQQDDLKRSLVRYTRYVIEDSWPAQRRGEVPTGGTDVLSHFERELIAFQPANLAQQAIHAEALHAFNTVVDFRRQRLEAVDYAVPGSLWAVVLIGAVLSIIATYVFNMESFPVHALMTGLLAAMIALLVFFIATTDLPYRGEYGIGPTAYELVLHDLMERGAPL